MKKLTKLLSLGMSLALCVSMFAGCGQTPAPSSAAAAPETSSVPSSSVDANAVDTSKEVKLVMYLLGDPPADNDKVFEQINAKLKEKINATIEPKYMSWGEYEQKYPLIFASGENFDLIYSADWAFYNAQSTKQGYWEITKDALAKYAPLTASTIYQEAWDQSLVDGKCFMLPMQYKEITGYVYMARGDLMKKYGVEAINNRADLEKYLDALAQSEKGMIPIDVGSDYDATFMFDRIWGELTWNNGNNKYEGVGAWQLMACVGANDPALNVQMTIDQPEYLQAVQKLKEYKDKGYWSKSAVVNTTDNRDAFKAGKSGLALTNLNTAKSLYAEVVAAHPEWDVKVFDAQFGTPPTLNAFWANGMSIFSKSKNPERALMALDLLRNDEAINDLFCYGIEGVHYQKTSPHTLKLLDASANYPYDGNCNWGVRNDATWKIVEGGIPNFEEINETWQKNCKMYKYAFFTFDDSSVKNEIAAINDVFSSNYKLLNLGFADDPAASIADMSKKMKAAGADKVYEAMHTQLQEYVATHP